MPHACAETGCSSRVVAGWHLDTWTRQVCIGEFKLEGKSLAKGDSVVWKKMRTHGDIPCPRKDFTVTSLDGKVVVQGGTDYDGNVLDDMYALDPHTGMWITMYRSDYTVCFAIPWPWRKGMADSLPSSFSMETCKMPSPSFAWT